MLTVTSELRQQARQRITSVHIVVVIIIIIICIFPFTVILIMFLRQKNAVFLQYLLADTATTKTNNSFYLIVSFKLNWCSNCREN